LELSEFDSFRAELRALIVIIQGIQKSTLHDESLRERFRTLFRTWTSTVEPLLATYHDGRREILKLHAEIEKLAQLASKRKPIADYKKYLRRACQLFRQYRNPTAAQWRTEESTHWPSPRTIHIRNTGSPLRTCAESHCRVAQSLGKFFDKISV
jgi:hypothetical protein